MTSPQDPRKEPFQDDEAALAKVLRALPGSEPSPKVDAAILAAARDATSGSARRPRRRRGPPGWALGTAAAAVLAVAIGMQLPIGRGPLPDGAPAEAQPRASANGVELDTVQVTGSRLQHETPAPPSEPEADAAAPQAKPAPFTRREPAAVAPLPPLPPPAPPPAPPAPASRAQAEELVREAQAVSAEAAAAQALDRSRDSEARRAAQSLPESAPVAESSESTGALPSAFSADDVLPPVDDDARLDADAWLERIRERIGQGDRAGASASLRRFERAHPDVTLPPDLADFRP
ncbi:MAG TPA: hypothetical protein VFY00_05845 [Arenimonas sp.]|nr:hypothetical protein [Arenimonas sp.]